MTGYRLAAAAVLAAATCVATWTALPGCDRGARSTAGTAGGPPAARMTKPSTRPSAPPR